MRSGSLFVAAVFYSLAVASTLEGQSPVPDYPVRVTLRASSAEQQLVGHLTAVTRDSLMVRVGERDFIAAIDRRTVIRVERQRRGMSIRRGAVIGCLALGGTLALLGSQIRDPDSPGLEVAAAGGGLVVGCGVGALAGAFLGRAGRQSWEEITL